MTENVLTIKPGLRRREVHEGKATGPGSVPRRQRVVERTDTVFAEVRDAKLNHDAPWHDRWLVRYSVGLPRIIAQLRRIELSRLAVRTGVRGDTNLFTR